MSTRTSSAPMPAPLAEQAGRVRVPEAHVGLVHPVVTSRMNDAPGRRGDRERRLRIPEEVDAERPVARGELRHDPRQHGDALGAGLQGVRPVTLVAEHDGVDSDREQNPEIGSDCVDDAVRSPDVSS